ncbi:MAG TPA: hypothetical protein PKX92_01410 [Edaphocola sp.]|nr:hypothetical protein [Edaphocola sp.]
MKKIILTLFNLGLIMYFNISNAQKSLCSPNEAKSIVESLSKNQIEDKTHFDDLVFIDSLTKEGFEKLQEAKEIVVLKVYAVIPIKVIDSSNFQTNFFDYFKTDRTVFCYLLFGKDFFGKFYNLGNFIANYREQRYEYGYFATDIDEYSNKILQDWDYKNATLILFWVNKKNLKYLIVNNDVLEGFKIEENSEYGFKSYDDFIMFLKKVYFDTVSR